MPTKRTESFTAYLHCQTTGLQFTKRKKKEIGEAFLTFMFPSVDYRTGLHETNHLALNFTE